MELDDPLLRMRCADAAEKITQTHPELLGPYASRLLDDVANSGQQEVRWHVALMLPRLPLTPGQRRCAVAVLLGYLDDGSRIVRANALESLTGLAESDASLRAQVTEELVRAADSDSAAVRVRARNMRRRLCR